MALYSELSCDESVIQRAHGTELVSALAKLALPERGRPLQAAALSRLSYRLARLAGPAQTTKPTATLLIDITVCGRHRGWRLSNHRAYRLLFRPEAIATAKRSLPAAEWVQLTRTYSVVVLLYDVVDGRRSGL